MSDLQLPFTIEYTPSKEVHSAHLRLVGGDVVARLRQYDRQTAGMFLFLSVSGFIAAIMGMMPVLAAIILAGSVAIGRQLWREYKSQWQRIETALQRGAGEIIRLEITDRGFTEHDRGIETFCPWSAMKNYVTCDGVLFVELANGLWAIVPAATLKPETVTLQQIEAVLVRHGVDSRP